MEEEVFSRLLSAFAPVAPAKVGAAGAATRANVCRAHTFPTASRELRRRRAIITSACPIRRSWDSPFASFQFRVFPCIMFSACTAYLVNHRQSLRIGSLLWRSVFPNCFCAFRRGVGVIRKRVRPRERRRDEAARAVLLSPRPRRTP